MMKSILLIGLCLTSQAPPAANDTPIGPADLQAYLAALRIKDDANATPTSFRDLWDKPTDFLGKPVVVEGRVQRVFRQGAVGEFPPLVETWLATRSNDLFCVVHPDEPATTPAGAWVRFTGVYLKRVRYAGGDVERLAPLIVGPSNPKVVQLAPNAGSGRDPAMDSTFGLIVVLIITVGIGRTILRRPPRKVPLDVDPAPVFVDGDEG